MNSRISPLRTIALLAVGLTGSAFAAGDAIPADADYRINVRSEVERAYTRFGREPVREHGKVYAIVKMDLIDNPDGKLVRPVNEFALLKNLNAVLAKRGFREAPPGTTPEILLTVLYGRGFLKNPYMDDSMIENDAPGIDGVGSMGGRTVTIVGIPKDIIRHKDAGYEEKLQRADGEKLILNVTAWGMPERKPGEKKQRPKQLWHVTINTDDADQDLNAQMEKMLAAGSMYFDREMDKEEVTTFSSLPEGNVKIGTPTVVEPSKPQK
jgi:hypothetical protein